MRFVPLEKTGARSSPAVGPEDHFQHAGAALAVHLRRRRSVDDGVRQDSAVLRGCCGRGVGLRPWRRGFDDL